MQQQIRMTKNGIFCKTNNLSVYLDPKSTNTESVNFVSHAHIDHLPKNPSGKILASLETSKIAKLRGYEMKDSIEDLENFSLIDSGHILGSKGLLFDDIFYTGDICIRDRGFLNGAKVPKCKTLITECTFGLPEFSFPTISDTVKQVNQIISELYSHGKPVLLLGYELGKAQTISQLFENWDPLFYHDSVKKMNDLHRKLGVELKDVMGHSEAEENGLLSKGPWVMVAPMMSSKNSFIYDMKKKYDAVTIGLTGWAKSKKFSFSRGTDYSIPLSDHCDFGELLQLVNESGAEKIYTVHGFVDEFADELNKKGFNAQPLNASSLHNYI